jgi:hypothetical protein
VADGWRLSEFENDRFDATKAASDQARNVALAGLAIVWLFAGPYFQGTNAQSPGPIVYIAGGALSLALALDLTQLVVRALMMNAAYNRTEKLPEVQAHWDEDPVVADLGPGVHKWSSRLWKAKMAALAVGYAMILVFFLHKIF